MPCKGKGICCMFQYGIEKNQGTTLVCNTPTHLLNLIYFPTKYYQVISNRLHGK